VLEVERRQDGLHQRREDVRRATEVVGDLAVRLEPPVEPDLGRDRRARPSRDDMGPDLRELPLGELRVPVVESARDDEPEDAVTQELESLVRLDTVVGLRGVAEDLLEPPARQRVDQPLERGGIAPTGAC
jgi:hypothetical protein